MTKLPADASTLHRLVAAVLGPDGAKVLDDIDTPRSLNGEHDPVPRRVIAHALNVVLYADLLQRVSSAADYLAARRANGRTVFLDHGAVRTIAWNALGALPAGVEQVARLLTPLGFRRSATYPLTRIRMTGYSYRHLDMPELIGQWFVSELHPDEMSQPVQHAVERVFSTSKDPVDEQSQRSLDALTTDGSLCFDDAAALLAVLATCFDRQHDLPALDDYRLMLGESAELAWIATEGTAFNHAADRVDDVEAVAISERTSGRPIKDTVEVSGSGRVRQTAHRASTVIRPMRSAEGTIVDCEVPGSFFEFIERRPLPPEERTPSASEPDGSCVAGLDLGFDASNAQGIFAMTRQATGDPIT